LAETPADRLPENITPEGKRTSSRFRRYWGEAHLTEGKDEEYLRMDYQVTIRYGKKTQRYLTLALSTPDVPSALRLAADAIPEDLVGEVDLVELREAPDFDKTFTSSDAP
jgi:hypothetical protein